MKIKQKIIAGTLSIVTVLSFGAQLPVSAMENRPGVFQEQFFPDEHNIADELWARAERTNTAEDWEAAAEACDKAHKAYEKSGNMEMAREFLANACKARGKSNQKNAEEISYNLSRFSVEEIEEKRNQAIDNWNKATECYEEAARLFKSTEARDDEDKKCEKLAKEVRANADFDTALAAWEKANKANTVESWNNAGQLFDQAAQSCRDAGFIEKSSSCDNKSREAFKKIESIKKSSVNIDTILEEEAKKQPTIESGNEAVKLWRKAGKTFGRNHIKSKINRCIDRYIDRCIVGFKQEYAYAALRKAMKASAAKKWDKTAEIFEEFDEDYKCIEIPKLLRFRDALKKAEKENTIQSWNEVAELCKELAQDFENIGKEYEANVFRARSKYACARIALKKAEEADTVESWNEAGTLSKEAVEAFKNSGEDDKAKKFIAESKQAYINAAWKEAKEQPTFEKWNKAGKLYEELAEDYKETGDKYEINRCTLNSKRAYANAALEEVKKQPIVENWTRLANSYKELAEEYKKAGDEKEANICIFKFKQAYSNVAIVQKDWNKVAEIRKELAEEYKGAGDKNKANICILSSKQAYSNVAIAQKDWNKVAEINKELAEAFKNVGEDDKSNKCLARFKQAYAKIALKKAKEANTIEGWNEADTLCKEAVEAFKNAGEDDKAKKFIAESKYEYAYAALKEAEKINTIEKWKEVAELWEKVAEAFKNAGEDNEANKCLVESKQEYAYAALEKAKKESTAENWNEVSKCYSEFAKACEKMADGESDVNKADSYRAIAKEYMKKANKYKQYAQKFTD